MERNNYEKKSLSLTSIVEFFFKLFVLLFLLHNFLLDPFDRVPVKVVLVKLFLALFI
jgi:hypothetical protein